jgi:hypothetical protein
MSNGTITASACSERALTTDTCPSLQSSLTCVSSYSPVPLQSTADLRTWLQAAFPANHSAPPASVPEPTTRAICGPQPLAVYKQSDPNMSFSKMSPDSYQRDPRLAYVAGLIDGEGCIGIQSSNKGAQYYVEITIGMTEKARTLLDQVQQNYGGTVTHHRRKTQQWANAWKWRIGGDAALTFLEMIAPYLVLKSQQAQLALKLRAICSQMQAHPNGTKKWTEPLRKEAQALKDAMHKLNQKGPDALAVGGGWYHPMPDLFGIWAPFSETWPRAGMTRAGVFYPQPSWERRISAIGSGLWGTPRAQPMGTGTDAALEAGIRRHYLESQAVVSTLYPTPVDPSKGGGSSRSEDRRDEVPSLQGMARSGSWPTPNRADAKGGPGNQGRDGGLNLRTAVALLPTPTVNDSKNNGGPSQMKRNTQNLNAVVGGQLSPDWVAWLMGWPLGWESLRPMPRVTWLAWLAAFRIA